MPRERFVNNRRVIFHLKDGTECAVEVGERIRAKGTHAHSQRPFNLDGIVVNINLAKLHRVLTVADFDGVESNVVDEDIDFFEKVTPKS